MFDYWLLTHFIDPCPLFDCFFFIEMLDQFFPSRMFDYYSLKCLIVVLSTEIVDCLLKCVIDLFDWLLTEELFDWTSSAQIIWKIVVNWNICMIIF